MSELNDLEISVQGRLGVITLNRASHLNALNLPMIQGINAQLEHWEHDEQVQAVLIHSHSAKAFCAGGDIRYLYDSYKAQNLGHEHYFCAEYAMLNRLRHFPKPVIALMNGYVLGGGFGLAQACHIKISSEKSKFAMPETAIGFFPDVAATYFLSRLDAIGVYLALTGVQISSSDALHLDLIDYHVPHQNLTALIAQLTQEKTLNEAIIRNIIGGKITDPTESELQKYAETIQKHFSYSHVEEIEQSLADEVDAVDQVWASESLNILRQRPMLAKKVSLELQLLGQNLSLEKSMQLERELQNIWFEQGDFIEGVRALIVDKDKTPHWKTNNTKFEKLLNSTIQNFLSKSQRGSVERTV